MSSFSPTVQLHGLCAAYILASRRDRTRQLSLPQRGKLMSQKIHLAGSNLSRILYPYALLLIGISSLCLSGCAGLVAENSKTVPATAPSITTEPTSQTVTVGQTAKFTVAATGTAPMTYQWKKNGAVVSGATSSNYTTPATTTADNGAQLTVIVTNSGGSTTSSPATLTVRTVALAPSITTQPASQTVTIGQTATFSVAATGTAPLTYQWKKNGTAISGASSSSYTTPATASTDNGSQFTVVVSNSVGSVTSGTATLTVTAAAAPPTISVVAPAAVQSSSATITWTTNIASDSQVDFGTSTSYGTSSALNSSLVVSHSVSLTGLTSSTLYHFRVKSRNSSGSLTNSSDFTFTTTPTQPLATGTSLAALAATMPPLSWATLTTNNISVLAVGSITGNVLPFGFKGVWDPIGKKAYYLGGDHGCPSSLSDQFVYDDASNTWSNQGQTIFSGCHGYDHLSIDPNSQTLYFWPYNDSNFANVMHLYNYSIPNGGPWNLLGAYTLLTGENVARGTDWFSGPIAGVGSEGGLMVYNCGSNGGEVAIYSPQTNSLPVDVAGFGGTGTYECFASYSKILNVGVFGGGDANGPNVWRLNSDGTVTTMPNSPIGLGVQQGNVAPDPVTGKFIVWGDGQLFEYDPTGTGTWTPLAPPPPNTVGDPAIPENVISIPISTYGVIMYATCRATTCRVDIYKHAGTSGTPPPAGSTIFSTVSVSSITSSSAVIGWTTTAAANSQLSYGTSSSYGQNSALSTSMVTSHSVTLSSLTAGSTYHFQAMSTDASGNAITSGDFSFEVGGGASPALPSVSISTPSSGSTVSTTVPVTASASSSLGIANVQFLLDSANVGSPITSSPYTLSWDSTTVPNGSHTLAAVAQDTAGNTATSAPVTVTVSNSTAPAGSADYQARCSAAGVVLCVGFDDPSDIVGKWGDNSGVLSGATTPVLDTTVKASGNSSLKFTIPAQAGADTSGSYWTNFSSNLLTQFGQNSDLYIQWRQRFSPEFLSSNYLDGEGWKQAIIGTGDVPGCNSASTSSACSTSCSDLEVVTLNAVERGFAQMYDSCSGSTSHGAYDPFEQPYGAYDFKLQNAMPAPFCLYSQGQTTPTTFFPPTGNCFGYFPNEWMTFQVHLKIGPRVNDEFDNSYVELWIAREGQPSQLVINWGPYNLTAGAPAANEMFGKVWLLPYNTNKDPNATYPVAYTWYDELIISSQQIADPQ